MLPGHRKTRAAGHVELTRGSRGTRNERAQILQPPHRYRNSCRAAERSAAKAQKTASTRHRRGDVLERQETMVSVAVDGVSNALGSLCACANACACAEADLGPWGPFLRDRGGIRTARVVPRSGRQTSRRDGGRGVSFFWDPLHLHLSIFFFFSNLDWSHLTVCSNGF